MSARSWWCVWATCLLVMGACLMSSDATNIRRRLSRQSPDASLLVKVLESAMLDNALQGYMNSNAATDQRLQWALQQLEGTPAPAAVNGVLNDAVVRQLLIHINGKIPQPGVNPTAPVGSDLESAFKAFIAQSGIRYPVPTAAPVAATPAGAAAKPAAATTAPTSPATPATSTPASPSTTTTTSPSAPTTATTATSAATASAITGASAIPAAQQQVASGSSFAGGFNANRGRVHDHDDHDSLHPHLVNGDDEEHLDLEHAKVMWEGEEEHAPSLDEVLKMAQPHPAHPAHTNHHDHRILLRRASYHDLPRVNDLHMSEHEQELEQQHEREDFEHEHPGQHYDPHHGEHDEHQQNGQHQDGQHHDEHDQHNATVVQTQNQTQTQVQVQTQQPPQQPQQTNNNTNSTITLNTSEQSVIDNIVHQLMQHATTNNGNVRVVINTPPATDDIKKRAAIAREEFRRMSLRDQVLEDEILKLEAHRAEEDDNNKFVKVEVMYPWTNWEAKNKADEGRLDEYERASAWVDQDLCFLSGFLKGSGGLIVKVPPPCRPLSRLIFTVLKTNLPARVDILPDGRVYHIAGGGANSWLSLNGIFFALRPGVRRAVSLRPGWTDFGKDYGSASLTQHGPLCVLSGRVTGSEWKEIVEVREFCRPRARVVFSVCNHDYVTQLQITPNGSVSVIGGYTQYSWMSLNGLSWPTTVGDSLPLRHNWQSYGEPYHAAMFHIVGSYCFLNGVITNHNSWDRSVTRLPEECRPNRRLVFSATVNDADRTARVDVLPDGWVVVVSGRGPLKKWTWLSLSGISFPVSPQTLAQKRELELQRKHTEWLTERTLSH